MNQNTLLFFFGLGAVLFVVMLTAMLINLLHTRYTLVCAYPLQDMPAIAEEEQTDRLSVAGPDLQDADPRDVHVDGNGNNMAPCKTQKSPQKRVS